MIFNQHFHLEGRHAFLGASKFHWVRYDDAKIKQSYLNHLAVQKGTELHDFAAQCIRLGQKLPKNKKTLNTYVNDAIGFKMEPEQVLYYSDNCFGTADAISFRNNFLRVHDYKSGVTPAHMDQLKIYVALFMMEYKVVPSGIEIRIYQSDEVLYCNPSIEEINIIIDKIKSFDAIIDKIKIEEI